MDAGTDKNLTCPDISDVYKRQNWWDNNAFTGDGELFGLLDRKTVTWRYPKIVDALMKLSLIHI